jgi:hypothetical protein
MHGIATVLLAPCWPAGRALVAGLGFAWDRVPTITVLGAADDPRLALVRDAVAFWNQTLVGSAQASAWARLLGRKGAFRTI